MKNVSRQLWGALAAVVVVSTTLATLPSGAAVDRLATPRVVAKLTTLKLPTAFNPIAPKGGHDLYHCSLLDPKVTVDQMIIQSTFTPGTAWEVHHAILYWVPVSQAAAARKINNAGKGWTCFGGPGITAASKIADLGNSSWLAGWSPGHGSDTAPTGTGVPLPKGSLIVMQIHYNLLRGHAPDLSKIVLKTLPSATSGLLPLHINLYPAAVDVPCVAGTSGALCNRANSLADIGKRFGTNAVVLDNVLEYVCNHNVPVPSVTSNCTWRAATSTSYIWRITPHMHMLGGSFKVTLDPGTAKERVLLNVPSYNFDYQRSYAMATPVKIDATDTIKVSCTFKPELRSQIAYLKSLPPRYILWGDGSSDEMCLGILGVTNALATTSANVEYHTGPTSPRYPDAFVNAMTAMSTTGVSSRVATALTPAESRRKALLLVLPHMVLCN